MKELLVFAKRYNRKNPTKIGGAIRLTEELLKDLDNMGEPYETIDINPANYGGFSKAYFQIFFQSLAKIRKHKAVLFIASDRVIVTVAPFVIALCKLYNKHITLKKIGGGFDTYYEKSPFLRKKVLNWVLKNVAVIFFETKQLVSYFSEFTKTMWFPNVRNIPKKEIVIGEFGKRFVFISHVKNTKGIVQILESSLKLPEDYTVHIYGPIVDLELPNQLEGHFEKIYQGPLEPEQVLPTIEKYDVVMLPTFYKGEGYPGIIIEAYSCGKPVISTHWNSIPEIIEERETGLLVKPRDSEDLLKAMLFFTNENYHVMAKNTITYVQQFDSFNQTQSKLSYFKGAE